MKGIVFTEFLDMVDSVFGEMMTEDILDAANLESEGAYTSVATYDYREMVALVTVLSERTNIPIPDLMKTFGIHLFGRFAALYPTFFDQVQGSLDFAETIENHIHVEVRKLYSDTQLPTFVSKREDGQISLIYSSDRPFADFAEGLLLGCIEHFNQDATLARNDLSSDRTHTEFVLSAVDVGALA